MFNIISPAPAASLAAQIDNNYLSYNFSITLLEALKDCKILTYVVIGFKLSFGMTELFNNN